MAGRGGSGVGRGREGKNQVASIGVGRVHSATSIGVGRAVGVDRRGA